MSAANHEVTRRALDGLPGDPIIGSREDGESFEVVREESVVEQYLFSLSHPVEDLGDARVQPNLWLLTADEMPPLLFSCEEVARLLHVSRSRVYELIRRRELRSVRIGATRRVSAKALAEYVAALDLEAAG